MVTKHPIKNKILYFGFVLLGNSTNMINTIINKIFSIEFVNKFFLIESSVKILFIIWACTSTPGTTLPLEIFTISNKP